MKNVIWEWDDKSGIIDIRIHNGSGSINRYRYIVDGAYIPGWKKRKRYNPFGVLNEIKAVAIKTIKLN